MSATRTNIIETASALFYKNGYNRTGINEVIKEAGIAKATLYSHFPSKDDLCLAYLQHRHAAFITGIEARALNEPTDGSQLTALFDFLADFFKTPEFCGCWAQRTISELPVNNSTIREEVQREKNELISLINRLLLTNKPELDDKSRSALSRQVYLLYEGAVSESYLQNDDWPISSAKVICKKILGLTDN